VSDEGVPIGDRRDTASSALESALTTERNLREQINDLVTARARAQAEARRLTERATLPGADATLGAVAERYASQSDRLAEEINSLRASLREQEADTERLRADEAGV
jgi:hypothetical protein